MTKPCKPIAPEPYLKILKSGLRKIRERVDSQKDRASSLLVWLALHEIASNKRGVTTFTATHDYIGSLCSLSGRTVQKRVHDLAEMGLISIVTFPMRAPCQYTICRSESSSERKESNSERSERAENLTFRHSSKVIGKYKESANAPEGKTAPVNPEELKARLRALKIGPVKPKEVL